MPAGSEAPHRCPTCGNMGIDGWHLARCAYAASLKARLEQHAATYDVPGFAAFDLFAHLRGIGDDGEQALKRAMTVMDLGWRPVVPSSSDGADHA